VPANRESRGNGGGDWDRRWQSPDIVSLREYVEQRLDAAERTVENARKALADQVQQRFSATQEAIAADTRSVESARKALAEQVEHRFAATQQAIDKTEKSVAERLLTLTNALAVLSQRAELFITRSEMGALLEKFDERSANNVQRQIYELRGIAELRMEGILREMELRETALNTRLELLNQATDKAAAAMDRRLEGMNEFREQLNNQTGTFVTRNEFAGAMASNAEARERLADVLGSSAGRVELAALAEKIDAVESAIDKSEGRRTVTTAIVALASSLIVSLATGLILFAVTRG
jgi:hypothetical protein